MYHRSIFATFSFFSRLPAWCVRKWYPSAMPRCGIGRFAPSGATAKLTTRVESVWNATASRSYISARCSG
jgi:hypothetical protein